MLIKEDFERLDERYVRKDDCTDKHTVTDERINNLNMEIAVVKTRLGITIGILVTIAIPVLAIAIKYLFGVSV